MPDPQSTPDTPPDFAAFLMATNKGRTHEELSVKLRDLVAEVQRTGKPGALTLAITVKPQAGNEDMVIVTDQVAVKPPKGERASSVFFIAEDFGLCRDNPKQAPLFYTEEKPAR